MSGQGGQPSRYNRSFGGMTGALIVTVLFVVAFVTWRGLFRTDTDDTPQPVDWQESVELADQAGLQVVRPRELPAGLDRDERRPAAPATTRAGGSACSPTTATSSGSASRTRRSTRSSSSTSTRRPRPATTRPSTSEVTDTWQTWSDDGGDHGYSTEVGDEAVLVYGSAPVEDIETYLGLLTQ